MKILSIVEGAYRGTLEEQDDAALWMTHAIRNAGADISVLIRGNAVSYAVKGQDPSGIAVGGVSIDHAPVLDKDLLKMKASGISIQIVREDIEARGISTDELVTEFELVSRSQVADIVRSYDQVWHW